MIFLPQILYYYHNIESAIQLQKLSLVVLSVENNLD